MLKTTFYILILCFPSILFSQNWVDDVKSKVWISNTNDTLIIYDSIINILNYNIPYQIKNEKLTLTGIDSSNKSIEEAVIILPKVDSIIVVVEDIISFMRKNLRKADFNSLKNRLSKLQIHLDENFSNKLIFYDPSLLDQYRNQLFKNLKISRFPSELNIDSAGNISIISSDYSSFFMVNKGYYIGQLPNEKLNEIENFLFNRKFYSLNHWGFFEKDHSTCSDCRPIDIAINSQTNRIKHEVRYEKDVYNTLISIVFSNDYPYKINLKVSNDSSIEHSVISLDREILKKGVESVSGKLELIKEDDAQFLYSLKIDSIYSERGVQSSFENNDKIYCISSNNYKEINNQQIGLILIKRDAYHTTPFNPLTKDRKLYYYEVVKDFSTSKSVFLNYFGLYNPRGMGSGLRKPMLLQRRPKRNGIFNIKSEKFNNLEKEIYKRKNVAQQKL